MTTRNNDRKVSAYAITTLLVLCFTVLPFADDIYKDLTHDSAMATTLVSHNMLYDIRNAHQVVVNVDALTVEQSGIITYAGIEVEIDPQVNIAELMYVMEEIVIRTDMGRVSIIAGDNGQF